MHKQLLISFFALLLFSAAKAQQNNQAIDTSATVVKGDYAEPAQRPNDTLYIDTTLYFARPEVSTDSVAAWKGSKEFAYVKNMDSLLMAAKNSQHQRQQQQRDNSSSGSSWLGRFLSSDGVQVFFWCLAIFFVLFILYKLFLTEGAFRRSTMASSPGTPEAEEEVITSESDLESLIRQALQAGNYRLAVRYKYLQTLYKLAAKKMVELAVDKTNYQYVREISNYNYQNEFAALTLNYEYVWYGEFEIEENIYRRIETGFSQFNNKL
jgi:hypothetical protein